MSLLRSVPPRALPRIAALLALAAALNGQPPPDVETILEFDGNPAEADKFSVDGPWTIEGYPSLVRSGTGSLRLTFAPPDSWPGLRVRAAALAQSGWRWIRADVHNPGSADLALWLRLDDTASMGDEQQIHRSQRALRPGWNTLEIDLLDLSTPSGRRLDAERLALLVLYANRPKERREVVIDHLRFERPAGDPRGRDPRSLLHAFEARYPTCATFEERRDLLRTLVGADGPPRCRALGARILRDATDARLVDEAIQILGRTKTEDGVDEALRLAGKAKDQERWRWLEALGRMVHPRARAYLLQVAGSGESSPDQTAALLAAARANDQNLVPLCSADRGGSWQLRAARVEVLQLVAGDAFPALTAFLQDESARVRSDAQEALVRLSGRDLGDDAGAWLRWWDAQRAVAGRPTGTAEKPRSPYGAYYGLPLSAGSLCFVIDVSGSMNEALAGKAAEYATTSRHLKGREIRTRLDLAREELIHAIQALPERAQVQIVAYNTEVHLWYRHGPRSVNAEAKADVARKLETLTPGGSTNIHGALRKAFEPTEDAPFRVAYRDSCDTVYLLSDGEPTAGEIVDPGHLVTDVRDRNRVRRIRINTIGMGRPNSMLLRELARHSGGTYVDLSR